MSEETIPQMRETIEAQAKEIKNLKSEVAQKSTEIRVRDAREAFRQAGYNPKHGDLFARETPEGDITAEAVAEFAGKWDLAPASTESSSEAPPAEDSDTSAGDDGTDALSGMDRSGTRGGEGGGGSSTRETLTRQQWMELQATDPGAAAQALNQGRVLVSSSGNLRAGQEATRGGNPYEPVTADS